MKKMKNKLFTMPVAFVVMIIVCALSMYLIIGGLKSRGEKRKALEAEQTQRDFVDSILREGKESFLFDNCEVWSFRDGCFLIRDASVGDSSSRVLIFAEGLAAVEEMGYEIRTQIAMEQLPNDMMIVWTTKKEPE